MTAEHIGKLRFRQLVHEIQQKTGINGQRMTMGQLRSKLKELYGIHDNDNDNECIVHQDNNNMDNDCEDEDELFTSIQFMDQSNPIQELEQEILEKAQAGHWKAATRKLKRRTRMMQSSIPAEIYHAVLEACMNDRLHGARASEPVRKILEQMMEEQIPISEAAGNYCIKNCIGDNNSSSSDSTHQGFGGIDTALAIKSVLDQAKVPIQIESYDKMIQALAKEASIDDGIALLREVVATDTPSLVTFGQLAQAAAANAETAEKVLTILALAKAAGYELDTISTTQDGRDIIAAGLIAAEHMGNTALGLRLLTAAANAKNVGTDRGDVLVCLSSSAAQRAGTLIHKNAIIQSVDRKDWKLSVKLLELMIERSLRPSGWLWRNVVTCCAKAEKSKKATALLLDWVKLYEEGKADQPPLSVFNTCVNACEICDEQELTLLVLDTMKKTHKTDGNLITFNIALKRLAKQGNYRACEGIIIAMLQAGVEPSVVSYTTAVASCASPQDRQAAVAYEWLTRMRSRNVKPNVLTYNTAFAACLDGTLESTYLGSKIAKEMMEDVEKQLAENDEDLDEYTNVVPDGTTKFMARGLMEQLKRNWQEGKIDKRVAIDTVRVPLLQLVDFSKSEVAHKVKEKYEKVTAGVNKDDDQAGATKNDEIELEFSAAHRTAEV